MASYKVMFGWFKKWRSGNSVSASQSSVSIGRDNFAPINIFHASRDIVPDALIDIKAYLVRQSQRQLDYEKRSGKYIPDIFIETRETKNLARSFAHPTLFFKRTLDELGRVNIPGSNRFLAKAGMPPLPFPVLEVHYSKNTLADVSEAATHLSDQLAETTAILDIYKNFSHEASPPFPIKAGCENFYEENTYHFQMLGYGMGSRIGDLLNELKAARAKILILTGRAGQGKTNFVCDFVENFLVKHEVPSAYLSGRGISAKHSSDLEETIQRLIFGGAAQSFADAAKLVSAHARAVNKPFVLIIDGLNEHHRISEFSAQLEQFIETVIEYPDVKLLLTCRSEFFNNRFGNLTKDAHAAYTLVLESHERLRDEERYDEMQLGYFKFFGVRRELVSDQVIESLKSDILLLRFFCEAYGVRNKPENFRQPRIDNIYREQIFKIYLEEKLGTADLFMRNISGKVTPRDSKSDLHSVLEHAVKYMLETWQFSDVPMSVIPTSLNDALYALLDEELVIRRDIPSVPSVFSPSEETVNFTFDEFRDYLIAQYLLYRVYEENVAAFNNYIARNDPKDSQIIEGTKRYLFYASRHNENETFWNFYHTQSWYMDVYGYEVFNIDTMLLRNEDCAWAVNILQGGGDEARRVARKLAIRWHPKRYPLLNLDLLLTCVIEGDDTRFNNLIEITFKSIRYGHEGSSASAFCKFIANEILPGFKPNPDGVENGLIQFLTLLLPVDSDANLNSNSMDVYRELISLHPEYAILQLRKSLGYVPSQHKPYVWRLLAAHPNLLSPDDPLVEEAQQVMKQSYADNSALRREVGRFLDRISSSA